MNCTWKHQYSDAHIAEAEQIIGHIMTEIDNDTAVMFDRDNEYVLVELSKNHPSYIGARYSEAKCSPGDCFSLTIGRMVALCKVTGTKLPDWI